MLKIHEETLGSGGLAPVYLRVDPMAPDAVVFETHDAEVLLPLSFLTAIFDRYGKPLADDVALPPPSPDCMMHISSGACLFHLRHLARYDVIARDFLVLVREGKEPLAELAANVTGALFALAARAT